MKYDNNITLLRLATPNSRLGKNQYYALMVEDEDTSGDYRQWFNKDKGQLGLEQTSQQGIYISKDYFNRHVPSRGTTWVVEVKNPKLCCVL